MIKTFSVLFFNLEKWKKQLILPVRVRVFVYASNGNGLLLLLLYRDRYSNLMRCFRSNFTTATTELPEYILMMTWLMIKIKSNLESDKHWSSSFLFVKVYHWWCVWRSTYVIFFRFFFVLDWNLTTSFQVYKGQMTKMKWKLKLESCFLLAKFYRNFDLKQKKNSFSGKKNSHHQQVLMVIFYYYY